MTSQPRAPRARRFLMCRPVHFDVTYSINPWMEPSKPTDADLAVVQWERLRNLLLGLGHEVAEITPMPGAPDMVFAANGATVVGGKALLARYRYPQRRGEGPAYRAWLRDRGYELHTPKYVNEGEGDYIVTGDRILAGTGFRTDQRSHDEARDFFGLPVVTLNLTDARFYHLDTALAVLGHEEVMYYPEAFDAASRAVLRELYPTAIRAGRADAEVFGLNAVSDGRHVLLAQQAVQLAHELGCRGYIPIGVDLSELLKAGGGAKCCTLELRDQRWAETPRDATEGRTNDQL